MTEHPRAIAAEKARELLAAVINQGAVVGAGVRVVEAREGVGCLILVWDARRAMPSASAERRGPTGRRAGCKQDILDAVRLASRPLTFKEVFRALREAGRPHGRGTVMKALAELTAAGQLVNLRDKRGYRLPEQVKPKRETPSLF